MGQAGTHQSEGVITVNLGAASAKLLTHQLEAPHFFLLPIMSAAVLSGASVVNFKGTFKKLEVSFDGKPLTSEDLEQSFHQTEGRLAELGLAIRAAGVVSPRRIVVASESNGSAAVLTVKDDSPRVFSTPATGAMSIRGTKVVVTGATYKREPPTLRAFLSERCLFSPVLSYRGKRLHVPRSLNSCGMIRFPTNGGEDPAMTGAAWVNVTADPQEFSGQVWLSERKTSLLTFVLNGVSYPREVKNGRYKGLEGVLNHPAIKLDLSRGSVVGDELFERIMKTIELELERKLFPQLVPHFRGMLPRDRRMAKPFLSAWIPHCDSQTAERVKRKIAR